MYYYGPMMDGRDWGFGILMMMFWLLSFAIIAVFIVKLLKGHGFGNQQKYDPLDIAKERYAKGEISKEQFEQLNKDLKS
jgi:putative membrane protein